MLFFAGWLASLMAVGAAWALPSEAQVQAQVSAGQYEQAEQSMAEVVAAKPDSAKAHYVYAQILAHQRKFDEAARQARRASELDPSLKFTQPEKFRAFETLLEREQSPGRHRADGAAAAGALQPQAMAVPAAAAAPSPGVPGWAWVAGLAVLGVVLWKALSRGFRAAPAMPVAPAGAYAGPAAYGGAPAGGWGAATGPTASPGSGLRTGLAAGAGLAGGLAAGMLLDEVLHRGDREGVHGSAAGGSGLLAGAEPGFFDHELQQDAADRLASREIDFGSGDSWDDGGSGGGSSGNDDW